MRKSNIAPTLWAVFQCSKAAPRIGGQFALAANIPGNTAINGFVKYERAHSRAAFRLSIEELTRSEPRLMTNGKRRYEPGHGKDRLYLDVNNDPKMRQRVSGYFSDHNFPTSCASNWSELKRTGTPPCLIIMDQLLDLNDGLDGLRSIRSKSDIPVIMTSDRSDEIDRIISLEPGADDYIVRPSPRELLARARAILRRREMARAARTRDPEEGATGSMAGGSSVVDADSSMPMEYRFR